MDTVNPNDVVSGDQHWGHATSPDLYHWTNQPIAIHPPNDHSQVWTGSAVIDSNNTSGFFPDQTDGVVAIYTLNTPTKQFQEIAYSRDGGYTFTRYDGNPVIDLNLRDFRDPKVVWYEDHWVMAVAFSTEVVIGIYTSPDLKHWTHSSNVSHVGVIGVYECPNLVSVPIWADGKATGELAWMLIISTGATQDGTITQYIPGLFDGYTFKPFDDAGRLTDFAKDNYAGQYFFGTKPDETVSIAWANNWQYTGKTPTDREGWKWAMSLPRLNYLTKLPERGWDLISIPYDLDPVKKSRLVHVADLVNQVATVDYSESTSQAIYFEAKIKQSLARDSSVPSSVEFTFRSKTSGEKVQGGYHLAGEDGGTAWLDRTNTLGYGALDPQFTRHFSIATGQVAKSIWGVIDRSILEVFLDDGAFSGTMTFYSTEPLTELVVETSGLSKESGVSLEVWELSSVWK